MAAVASGAQRHRRVVDARMVKPNALADNWMDSKCCLLSRRVHFEKAGLSNGGQWRMAFIAFVCDISIA